MARYTIDPARSHVTVVTRPRLGAGAGAAVRSLEGTVELDAGVVRVGGLTVTLEGNPAPSAEIDLAAVPGELGPGPDGETVLVGRADRPAGVFGLTGPPLLNPTLQFRWRLVLVPE